MMRSITSFNQLHGQICCSRLSRSCSHGTGFLTVQPLDSGACLAISGFGLAVTSKWLGLEASTKFSLGRWLGPLQQKMKLEIVSMKSMHASTTQTHGHGRWFLPCWFHGSSLHMWCGCFGENFSKSLVNMTHVFGMSRTTPTTAGNKWKDTKST